VTRVLVVGMLDSVHLARWLLQFKNANVNIVIFPSCKFKKLHPQIEKMLKQKEISYYKMSYGLKLGLLGYLDFLSFETLGRILKKSPRASALRRFLTIRKIEIVHLIELQHAGYLFIDARIKNKDFTLITTNYGSDIYFFRNVSEHYTKITQILSVTDCYSAECFRDYTLATELGFVGKHLPLMPNAGGFEKSQFEIERIPLNKRNIIYVKGYGGMFGLGAIALQATSKLLDNFAYIEAIVVSLTDDLAHDAAVLKKKYRERITFYRIDSPLSQSEVLGILRKSIVCIGASRSDGISTTFLEALVSGAVPVQTNTSCANEWTEKGFFAKIVNPSFEAIYEAASEIVLNPSVVDIMTENNLALAKKYLDSEQLSHVAQTFYVTER